MADPLIVPFDLYFDTKEKVSVSDFIESLKATDRLIKETPKIFASLNPALKISSLQINVEKIEAGSLLEDLIIEFVFGSEDAKKEWIRIAREKLHMNSESKSEYAILLRPIFALLIGFGGLYAAKKFFGSDAVTSNLELHNSVYIQMTAETFDTTPEKVQEIINTVAQKTNVASAACKVCAPIRNKQGQLIIDGQSSCALTKDHIDEMPLTASTEAPRPVSETFEDILMIVHAADFDSNERGWAASFPQICKTRIKIEIENGIEPRKLLHSDGVKVLATFDYGTNKDGDTIYKKAIVHKITAFPSASSED